MASTESEQGPGFLGASWGTKSVGEVPDNQGVTPQA